MDPAADCNNRCELNGDDSGVRPACIALDRHEQLQQRLQYHRGWRRIVINFTPSWFSVNMGTGIASILLHNLPYNATWLYWISVVIFCLNVAIFLLFLSLSIMRYTMFPGIWTAMVNHPVQSLFLGMSVNPATPSP